MTLKVFVWESNQKYDFMITFTDLFRLIINGI